MSPKRPPRSILNIAMSVELKSEVQAQALKEGHTRIEKGGAVVGNSAGYFRSLHAANVAQIGPVEDAPEVVMFEGMTPGEQWHFLCEVFHYADRGSMIEGVSIYVRDGLTPTDSMVLSARDIWRDPRTPGYKARYDAALAHVKGVMDADK